MKTRPLWSLPRDGMMDGMMGGSSSAEVPPDANIEPRGESLPRSLGPARRNFRADPIVIGLGSVAAACLVATVALASRDRARSRATRRERGVTGALGGILVGLGALPWIVRRARVARDRRRLRRAFSTRPATEHGAFALITEEIVASSASGM